MLAETAHLITQLDLRDGLSTGMGRAEASVRGFSATTQTQLRNIRGSLDRASSHFQNRVGQMTRAVGTIGLLGGAAALVKYSKDAIGAAEDWGRTSDRIHQLTGASIEDASRFADAYEKLGISQDKQIRVMGFLSKTLGNLNMNRKQARQLEKEYGFDLVGTNGRVRNALDITRKFTEYFNDKTIPAYQKASLGAQLYGRGWTDMIPIFEMGTRKMDEAMDSAMSLNKQQVKDLHRWRDAQRELNDTLGDTSVQVGLILVPFVTKLAKGLNEFVTDNQKGIRQFFRDLLRTAEDAADFIGGTVIPTVGNLASSAASFWNGIPGPLRDLLVKGFVADRAIKFLFGFSITGAVGSIVKDALGGVVNRFLGRGASPASPMYVSVVGGGLGGVAGAAGGTGMGLLGKAAMAVSIVGVAAGVFEAWNEHIIGTVSRNQAANREAAEGIVGQGREKSMTDLTNMARLLREAQGAERVVIDTTSAGEIGRALVNASKEVLQGSSTAQQITDGIARLQEAQQQATEHGWTEVAASIGADIEALRRKTPSARDIAEATAREGTSRRDRQNAIRIGEVIKHLRGVDDDGQGRDYGFERSAQRNAARLIRALSTTGKDRDRVIRDTIGDLKREQRRAEQAGATRLARNLGRDITVLRNTLSRKQDTANTRLSTIARKDPDVNVTVPVTTNVSIRDVQRTVNTSSRYGMQAV